VGLLFFQCPKITDDGLNDLSEALKGLLSLKALDLDFYRCEEISDEGLEKIGESLKGLASLRTIRIEFPRVKVTSSGRDLLRQTLRTIPNLQNLTFY